MKSETSKVRHLIEKYCTGHGIDLGCGGDKVVDHCIGFDMAKGYINYDVSGVDETGDARNLARYKRETFDFVYSSHLIEDFTNTAEVLREWWRVIKKGGRMILVFPDQYVYHNHYGGDNPHHKIPQMGLEYMMDKIRQACGKYDVLFTSNLEIDYNVIIVLVKIK